MLQALPVRIAWMHNMPRDQYQSGKNKQSAKRGVSDEWIKQRKGLVSLDVLCPVCGSPMRPVTGRFGDFWGCSGFPQCRGTRQATEQNRYSELVSPKIGAARSDEELGDVDREYLAIINGGEMPSNKSCPPDGMLTCTVVCRGRPDIDCPF